MPQCLLHSYKKHWLNDCVDDLTPIQHQTKLIINQLTPNFATWRPKNYLFTQIDLLHIWPKQAVTMAAQAKFLLQPSNTPFSCYQCHFPPTFIILPAYIQYDSVLAYQRGPVRLHVYRTTIGFQQISLPRLSDLTVGVEFSSYLQSFTAAPFQLYSADWLC